MGRNGAGKTTLLRAIAGVHTLRAGSVAVAGRAPRPGIDVGLCPQEPESILFNETVADEVRATLDARAVADDDPRPRCLERLGIARSRGPPSARPVGGPAAPGRDRRVAATGAPVLLLDEPTRGSIRTRKDRLARFLRAHAADGGVAMFATHDVELAAAVATRVVMLAGGEVIADGRPRHGARGLARVRAADDPRVRSGLAHARAGRGGDGVRPYRSRARRGRGCSIAATRRIGVLRSSTSGGVAVPAGRSRSGALDAHGTDEHRTRPLILAGCSCCLGALLFVELGRGGLGPKAVALIGVLGAAMVALRLPGFVAGFSAMFIVVLVAGNAFGPGFGFLLGAVGTFASGLFVGGLGPWLPFQMVAVGWVGLGAGMLPGAEASWRVRIGALAAYGFVVGYSFGAVMNLWSWPFMAADRSSLGSGGRADNLQHYLAFYAATSFAWDTFRAVGNAALVLVLGRPLLGSLDRAARRMRLDIHAPTFVEPLPRVTVADGR